MRKTTFLLAAGLCAAALTPAWAVPPPPDPTVHFGIVPSISVPGGIAPTHNAADTFYLYTYEIASGAALTDTIPIKVCVNTTSNPGLVAWTDQVVENATGGLSSIVTAPDSPWNFSDADVAGSCYTSTLNINIPAGSFTGPAGSSGIAIVQFKTQNQSTPHLHDFVDSPDKIHIRVTIADSTNNLTCYLTDSDGNFLLKADGVTPANASGDTSGTFAIVANAKNKVVATNPGQFYFNLLWDNPGTVANVTVTFADTGLIYNGNQANHWFVFPTSGFTGVTQANFDAVNDGNPAGHGLSFPATVPAINTLYATQHLEWAGLGGAAPTGPVTVSVTGTIGSQSCAAGATGLLKQ